MLKMYGNPFGSASLVEILKFQFQTIKRFRDDAEGSATMWSILWTLIFLIMGGLAIDNANALRHKEILQATADSAVLAGAAELTNYPGDHSEVLAEAVRVAALNMGTSIYGDVLSSSDVEVGVWDENTRVFTPTNSAPDAVRVTTRETTDNGNPVGTFLLRLIGFNKWDVAAVAVARKFNRECLTDGFFTADEVEISSNNIWREGFCVHGELGVRQTNHNTWEVGTTISMPDLNDFQSGPYANNPGTADALAQDSFYPRAVDNITNVIMDLENPNYLGQPSYIDTSKPVQYINVSAFSPASLVPNSIHVVDCGGWNTAWIDLGPLGVATNIQATGNGNGNGNGGGNGNGNGGNGNGNGNGNGGGSGGSGSLDLGSGLIEDVVILTDCDVGAGNGFAAQNVTIGTTNTGTVNMPQGVRLGLDDSCAPGGGVSIWSEGSIHFPAQAEFYGTEWVMGGEVHMAAQVNGMEGINIQAKGQIKVTSNNDFGPCMDPDDLVAPSLYYQLVQ